MTTGFESLYSLEGETVQIRILPASNNTTKEVPMCKHCEQPTDISCAYSYKKAFGFIQAVANCVCLDCGAEWDEPGDVEQDDREELY
jgi:hypothetical protein